MRAYKLKFNGFESLLVSFQFHRTVSHVDLVKRSEIKNLLHSFVVAAAVAKLSGAKSWLHVQDFELDAAIGLGLVSKGKIAQYIAKFERWLMCRFDRVSTISQSMLRTLIAKGVEADRCVSLVNWVDTRHMKPLTAAESMRDELSISASTKVVLYSGNLGKKQGLEIVLDAAEKLSTGHTDVLLLIVGEGAARKELESSATSRGLTNIRFLPLQPVEKLPALLATADIQFPVARHEQSVGNGKCGWTRDADDGNATFAHRCRDRGNGVVRQHIQVCACVCKQILKRADYTKHPRTIKLRHHTRATSDKVSARSKDNDRSLFYDPTVSCYPADPLTTRNPAAGNPIPIRLEMGHSSPTILVVAPPLLVIPTRSVRLI